MIGAGQHFGKKQFLKKVLEALTGCQCKLVHRVDSNSCRALLNREGFGGLKHVDLAFLWCQEKRRDTVNTIGSQFCPSDKEPNLIPLLGANSCPTCAVLQVVKW